MQSNQNQYQQPNQPKYTGAWDFLNTPQQPPKKPSFIAQNKKLVVIAAVSMFLLVVATLLAVITAPKDAQNIPASGAVTDVPTTTYNGQQFSMSYASTMSVQIDEATEDPIGWFVNLSDNLEQPSYDISIEINDQLPVYVDGADAITNLLNIPDTSSKATTKVILAGKETDKTEVQITNSFGEESVAVYSTAQVGDKFVSVYGSYPKNNLDISNSFDAMLGSIKLN